MTNLNRSPFVLGHVAILVVPKHIAQEPSLLTHKHLSKERDYTQDTTSTKQQYFCPYKIQVSLMTSIGFICMNNVTHDMSNFMI
jgi:hypothetical protein